MRIIARIHTDMPEKFGIPRQSGLVPGLKGRVVFEPEYKDPIVVRGLEGFNYIWLLWQFEGVPTDKWSTVVTPPRLGGKTHMGVFATRSPFRPNPIGLSSVKLESVEITKDGPVLHVSGVDLKDNTPIYDIKPYLPYADCHPDATEGFAATVKDKKLLVDFPKELLHILPVEKRETAIAILEQDPRPAYHDDGRKYGVSFAGFDIRFQVEKDVLRVVEVEEL